MKDEKKYGKKYAEAQENFWAGRSLFMICYQCACTCDTNSFLFPEVKDTQSAARMRTGIIVLFLYFYRSWAPHLLSVPVVVLEVFFFPF